jgi:hypothetical protein
LLPAIPAPPSVRFPPRLQTSQRALLVGCNYVGQSGELKGCGNDVLSIKSLLTKTYGWNDDKDRLLILVWFFSSRVCFSTYVNLLSCNVFRWHSSMRILSDSNRTTMQPTKQNIMSGLEWLVKGCISDLCL